MASEIENKRPNITKKDVNKISKPTEEKAAEGREELTTNTAKTAAPYNRDEKTVE